MTIITTATTTPLDINGSSLTVAAPNGSVSTQNETAIALLHDFTALIEGYVTAVNANAIEVSAFQANATSARLEIGTGGRVVAVSTLDSGTGTAIKTNGNYQLFNYGEVSGSLYGIHVFGSEQLPGNVNTVIFNYGDVTGAAGGVLLDGNYIFSVNNYGVIHSGYPGVESTHGESTVFLNNFGLIEGGTEIGFPGPAVKIAGGFDFENQGWIIGAIIVDGSPIGSNVEGPTGSKIVSTGGISAGQDGVAIQLGDGDDVVKNKGGIIDGEVHLGGGADKLVYKPSVEKSAAKAAEFNVAFDADAHVAQIFGGKGRDELKVKGDAVVDAGAGKDVIKFGSCFQTFIHNDGDGKDKLLKFKPGKDKIDLSDHNFDGFSDLKSAISEKNNKLVFDLPGKDQLMLKGVDLAKLSADDFVL